MATIKEIAKLAGVSIGTVDRVLHQRGKVAPEKEAAIRKIIQELEYKPNCVGQGLAIRKKKLSFSFFIMNTVKYPFFFDVMKGAKKKAESLEQYGIKVHFYEIDFENEKLNLENLETDGLVLIGIDNVYIRSLMEWAQEREKPIVCYNVPLLNTKYLAYVGCDYVQAGKLAAGLCALVSDSKGKIGIISEDDGKVLSFRQRFLGFRKEVKNRYPDMEILGVYSPNLHEEGIQEAVYRMFWEHPEMDTVYLINPGVYSACKIIHEAAQVSNIKIITNDLVKQQRQLVESGVITATICQEPEKQGELPLEILFQYVVNGIFPKEKDNLVTLSIHISQNV